MSEDNQSANKTAVDMDTTKENSDTQASLADLSFRSLSVNLGTNVPADYKKEYINKWPRSLTILHRGHWDAARHYERVNLGLGLATAISAAIAGTTAFTQLQKQAEQGELNIWLQVGVGLFALIAAGLGAAQAFMRPSERAAQHKQAAQKFGKLRREIELQFDLGLPHEYETREKLLTDFRQRWDIVDEESLPLPKGFYEKQKAGYGFK